VAAGGGAGAASGEDAGEVTGDVPLAGLADGLGTLSAAPAGYAPLEGLGHAFPNSYSQRSFRPKQADAFSPRSSVNESACAVEQSLFDPSRQPTPLIHARPAYSGLSQQV
jgi:hypothetical protein